MRSSWRSNALAGVAFALIVSAAAALSAHRRDEYLQAGRLAIDPQRVQIELDLTAGIAVADVVLDEIDHDRSGSIAADEARAYAAVVRSAIRLEVDGGVLPVELLDASFPTIEAVRNGEGTIHLEFAAAIPPLSAGSHHLLYRNTHRPDIGVYLANALVPASDRVVVRSQRRDLEQRELIVDYELRADASTRIDRWMLANVGSLGMALAALWWHRSRTRRPR